MATHKSSKSPKALLARVPKSSVLSELAPTEAPAPVEKLGEFGIITQASALPPDIGKRATKVSALPFADWFTRMKVGQHVYLPDAFWEKRKQDGHLNPDTKIDSTYVRTKVRGAFNKWKEADVGRASVDLTIYPRPNGISPADDPNFPTDPRPGFSLYLIKAPVTS